MTTYERAVSLCRWINEHSKTHRCNNVTGDYPNFKKCGGRFFLTPFPCPFMHGEFYNGEQLLAEFADQAKEQGWEGVTAIQIHALLRRFMQLSFVESSQIASELQLIEPGDCELSDLDKRKVAFARAEERQQLVKLSELMRKQIYPEVGG